MRQLTSADYKAIRVKESYYLYLSLSKGNAANVSNYRKVINCVDSRNHSIAVKIVNKLEKFEISDYEGYTRAAFLLFNQPYLNALLSDKVVKDYVSRLQTRLSQFSNNIVSCLNKFVVDYTTPPISIVKDPETQAVLATSNIENPIVRLYLLSVFTNRTPSKLLIKQAILQYKLWPFAFHSTNVGKMLLDRIGHLVITSSKGKVSYASTLEKNDSELLCEKEQGE